MLIFARSPCQCVAEMEANGIIRARCSMYIAIGVRQKLQERGGAACLAHRTTSVTPHNQSLKIRTIRIRFPVDDEHTASSRQHESCIEVSKIYHRDYLYWMMTFESTVITDSNLPWANRGVSMNLHRMTRFQSGRPSLYAVAIP